MNQYLDENLLGYLLGSLDEDTKAQVAGQIQSDPKARWRLDQLRLALEPLAWDKEAVTPPPGLATRTVSRVLEPCCLEFTQAPVTASRSSATRSRWRRADYVVAASLLLMALGLGLPALFSLRNPKAAMIECQNNMRVFNVALQTYQDQHRQFPSVVVERPRDAAGMVVPILANAGVLQEPTSVRCPGSGPAVLNPMSLEEARALLPEEFFRQAANLAPGFAYSLGHRDEEGNYYGPAVPDGQQAGAFPLLADGPPRDGGLENSNNHFGTGQNVLFADGHVRFLTQRTIGIQNDDIYRNKANKVAAGLDPCDTVLGASAAKP